MSGTVMSPYANMIAFEGVETGNKYEKDTAIVTGNMIYIGCIPTPFACKMKSTHKCIINHNTKNYKIWLV